jgi:hypothetical protein
MFRQITWLFLGHAITKVHATMLHADASSVTRDVRATRDFVLQKLQGVQCPAEILEMIQNSDPESLVVTTKVWYRPPWQVAFASFRKGTVTVAGDASGDGGRPRACPIAGAIHRRECGGRADEACDKTMIVGAATAIREYVRERRLRVVRLSLEAFAMGRMLQTKWLALKLACLAILFLLGTKELGHTNYHCGRL